MFKQTLAGSAILAVAQAIAFNTKSETGLSLAQTSAEADPCCCSAMPCMPTCGSPCGGYDFLHPQPRPETPAPIKNIELNLDVILTHILHEVNPPEIPSDPHELIHNVVTPIVIELINNDVIDNTPTCTWPEGTEAADWGINEDGTLGPKQEETIEGNTILPSTEEVLREVMEQVLDDLDLPASVDKDQLIEDSMPTDDDVAEINIQSEDGLEEIDLIVSGLEKHVQQVLDGQIVDDATEIPDSVSDLSDQFSTDIEQGDGVDSLDLQEVVDEAM